MAQPFENQYFRSGVMTRSQSLRAGRGGHRTIDGQNNLSRFETLESDSRPMQLAHVASQQDVSNLHVQNKCNSDSALNRCLNNEVRSHTTGNTYSELKVENNKLRVEVSELSTQLDFVTSDLDRARSELARMKVKYERVTNDLENSKYALEYTKEELTESHKQLSNMTQELEQVSTELDNTKYGLEYTTNELNESKRQLSNMRHEMQSVERKSQQSQIESDVAKQEIVSLKGELLRLRSLRHDYSANAGDFYSERHLNRYEYNHGNQPIENRSISGHDGLTSCSQASHPDEPKFRLPYFNGKTDLKSFLSVFEIGVRKFQWDNDKQIEQLMCCLKDDALAFVTKLPVQTKASIAALTEALDRRYGDHLLPEHYRENLNQVRKSSRESLSEYAARVEDLVNKAYPTSNSPELLTTLTIENLLKGYGDQSIAYEVRTKSPKTVDEALKLITWHECCKNGAKRRTEVRQVGITDEQEQDHDETYMYNHDVRKIGTRYVTEERLVEFKNEIKQDNTQMKTELKDEIHKLAETLKNNCGNQGNKNGGNSNKFSNVTCYTCNQKGHTSRFCRNGKEKRGKQGSVDNNLGSRRNESGPLQNSVRPTQALN